MPKARNVLGIFMLLLKVKCLFLDKTNLFTMKITCEICKKIPERVDGANKINKFRNLLVKIEGSGRYYRGESLQLSTFSLLKCPECGTYYEDGHHYYSDPESTMGLGRDEDDWYCLERLNDEWKETLKSKLE